MLRRISSLHKNPFSKLVKEISLTKNYRYYSLPALGDSRTKDLPYSIRILLESAIRNCDEFTIKSGDVENILD